jgi:hypothetical protein
MVPILTRARPASPHACPQLQCSHSETPDNAAVAPLANENPRRKTDHPFPIALRFRLARCSAQRLSLVSLAADMTSLPSAAAGRSMLRRPNRVDVA